MTFDTIPVHSIGNKKMCSAVRLWSSFIDGSKYTLLFVG